jgi:hypothetical protein
MITEPGIYTDIPADDYHRDPCPEPSLSSSIAKVLIGKSPWHAFHQHPRLAGEYDDKPSREKEIGTAVHKLLLGRGAEIAILDYLDYRKDAAQEARRKASEAGQSPILRADAQTAQEMCAAARDQLLGYPELLPLVDGIGTSEAVIAWQDIGDVWCRGMVDWLHPSEPIRADIKTTTASAHPSALSSRLFSNGADVQERFYHRGLGALGRPTKRSFYICLEQDPPHGLSVAELDPQAEEIGDEKSRLALEIWGRCIKSGVWPGYEQAIAVAQCPPWYASEWHNRKVAGLVLQDIRERENDYGLLLSAG